MRKLLREMLVTTGLALIVLSVALGVQTTGEELAEQQLLRISLLTSDLHTLDPHFATTTADRITVDMIFDGLLRYKPGEYPAMEPGLATDIPEPETVDGKQIWVFNLRKGVITHPFPGYPDGYELTAEDVVYSLERAADPNRSAWAGDYIGMHFEAVNQYTVKITLDKPVSPALFLPKLADYSGGFIVPRKAIEAIGDEGFKTHPVGTGPFRFVQYLPMEKVILRRHDAYFRGEPILEEVHGVYIAAVAAAELGLRKGELEAMLGPTEQPWVEKMEALEGILVDVFGPGENITLHYNTKKPPLDSLRVRKAIAYALSRAQMIALFGEKICSPTYSLVPAGFMTGALSKEDLEEAVIPWEVDPPNLEKARELLADAGYPEGLTLEVYSSERAYYLKPFELVQAQLRNVGIDLKITVVDHSTYHSMIRKDANHMVFYNVWRPSPDVYLTRFFHSFSEVVYGESPDTNFSRSELVDELIEEARYELDPSRQEELWKETQIALARNAAISAFGILQLTCARVASMDWGHPVIASMALYPQINETTRILKR